MGHNKFKGNLTQCKTNAIVKLCPIFNRDCFILHRKDNDVDG